MTCRDEAAGATHSAVALRLDRRAQDAVWLPWRRAADAAPITTDTVDAIARSEPGMTTKSATTVRSTSG